MKKFILIITFALLLSAAQRTDACQCSSSTVCENYKNSETIFIGLVEKVKEKDGANVATVRVEKIYKGKLPKRIKIIWGFTSCDVELKTGDRWLLYPQLQD